MKKRIVSLAFVMALMVSFFSLQALAAFNPDPPSYTPGLTPVGYAYSKEEYIGNDYRPEGFDDIVKTKSTTITVPSDSKLVEFIWWDHGERNGNVGSNQGWVWNNTTRYEKNGEYYPQNILMEGCDRFVNGEGPQMNVVRANLNYVAVPVSAFTKTNDKLDDGQTFEVFVSRNRPGTTGHVNYSIKYTINWVEAPNTIEYNNLKHWITGLDSNMEFRYNTGTWSPWYTFSSGSNLNYNMYPHLSTTCDTQVEVRFKRTASAPPSATWTYTVPQLSAAPSGLNINWYNGTPALFGLDASRYYAISNSNRFDEFSYIGPGYTAVLLDSTLKVGDVVYVRSAANADTGSPTSGYVAVTVPELPTAPTTNYNSSSHFLFGLQSTMDFRITLPGGWSNWVKVTADNTYFNAYPYLSTANDSQIQVRYRATPTLVQTIAIPALAEAPSGMSLEWVNDVGLVLWGLDSSSYYNLWTDAKFNDWYIVDKPDYGLNVSSLNLQPGDALYVRVASDSLSPSSACVKLIVPVKASSATPSLDYAEGELTSDISGIISDKVVRVEGWQVMLKNGFTFPTESDDYAVSPEFHSNIADESGVGVIMGTPEVYTAESSNAPILSDTQ